MTVPARARSDSISGPGGLLADVAVDARRQVHGFAERGLEPRPLDERPDHVESAGDRGQDVVVSGGRQACRGNLAEVPVGAGQHPVDEIPPRRDELVVVPTDELGPGEVGVLGCSIRGSAATRGKSGAAGSTPAVRAPVRDLAPVERRPVCPSASRIRADVPGR